MTASMTTETEAFQTHHVNYGSFRAPLAQAKWMGGESTPSLSSTVADDGDTATPSTEYREHEDLDHLHLLLPTTNTVESTHDEDKKWNITAIQAHLSEEVDVGPMTIRIPMCAYCFMTVSPVWLFLSLSTYRLMLKTFDHRDMLVV